jgi:hypothetical protein
VVAPPREEVVPLPRPRMRRQVILLETLAILPRCQLDLWDMPQSRPLRACCIRKRAATSRVSQVLTASAFTRGPFASPPTAARSSCLPGCTKSVRVLPKVLARSLPALASRRAIVSTTPYNVATEAVRRQNLAGAAPLERRAILSSIATCRCCL